MKKIKGDFRVCRDCGLEKHKDSFVRNHVFSDGIDTLCKACNVRRLHEWRAKGKRDAAAESRRYYRRHKDKYDARMQLRKERVYRATPLWLTRADRIVIANWESVARLRRFLTGEFWTVDHIVPFAGETVCGLHVPWNMRVIHGKENQRKANKLVD